jgi:hypothetical protein
MREKKKTKADMPPFDGPEETNAALAAFYAAVASAREEFGIQDVVLVAKADTRYPDGRVLGGQSLHSWGDTFHALPMVAQAYGQLMMEYQQILMELRAPKEKLVGGGSQP